MRKFEVVKPEHRKYEELPVMPKRATRLSAGYDFVTPVEIVLKPHESSPLIPTDIKVLMEDDMSLELHVRSSLGIKKGLILSNVTGIIDADYYGNPGNDGNIGFKLTNTTDKEVIIPKGEAVMQGIFRKYFITDDDESQETREGGFGSTSK